MDLGDLYRMIARASFAVDIMIERDASGEYKIPMDESVRNRYIAECRFLRGYCYFRLARNFGGVMLTLQQKMMELLMALIYPILELLLKKFMLKLN